MLEALWSQTNILKIILYDLHQAPEKGFPIHFVHSFLQRKLLYQKRLFYFLFFLPRLLHCRIAIAFFLFFVFCFFFTKEHFFSSLVNTSAYCEWVGDKTLSGDIKLSPENNYYHQELIVAIVSLPSPKKCRPVGTKP